MVDRVTQGEASSQYFGFLVNHSTIHLTNSTTNIIYPPGLVTQAKRTATVTADLDPLRPKRKA
jgi:hypothetical protein